MQNPTCFVAGTLILTAAGLVAIEKIKAGDKVVSTNVETFATSEKSVLETYVREASQLIHLTVNGELISTTIDHPVYVKERGFIKAGELQVGNIVVNSNQDTYLIEHVYYEIVSKPVLVYNFQVEEFHTYHVGVNGILVHNAEYTTHGLDQAKVRGFNDSKVDNIIDNPSQKVFQSEGRTVFAKKNGGYYDVVVTNSEGKVITCVGGNTKSLSSWNAVAKMLDNQGGYSSLPIN